MDSLRQLPSVDRILSDKRIQELIQLFARDPVLATVRDVLACKRAEALEGHATPGLDHLVEIVIETVTRDARPRLRSIVNGTGVIIQTNLGRAPVSEESARAMAEIAMNYSNLEFDLDLGERGSRASLLEPLLCTLTGAEAAIAVNNNASALLLALAALTAGREVVISRGQLVEIGGGFRIPDVMLQSGARLVEVGTTNRTYARDYVEAITEATGALLRVHASNFRVLGFTHDTSLKELVDIARSRQVAVIDDLGSGTLLDTAQFGLAHEPTIKESVATGADVVSFSGDKLLGGPQAGILVGQKSAIDRLRRHPLARAVRLDKASIAGLEVTLGHYHRGEAVTKIPLWQMIATPLAEIERRVLVWSTALVASGHNVAVEPSESAIGGGSLPGETLPTRVLAIIPGNHGASALAKRLRQADPPLVARIERDRILIDPRTVFPHQDAIVLHHLLQNI